MRNQTIIYLSFIIFLFPIKNYAQNRIVKVDIFSARNIKLEDYISEVKLISLDNSNTVSDPWKVIIDEKYIYTYSFSDLSVSIYNTDGRHLNTLRYSAYSVLTYPVDLFILKEKGELWVLNEYNTMLRYSLDGKKLLDKKTLLHQASSFINIDSENLALFDGYLNKTTKGHLSILNLPKGTTAKYVSIPNHNKLNSIVPATLFTKSDKEIYALLPHNDTVYKIIMQDGFPKIEPHIKIDFHGDFLDYSKWPSRGFTDEEFAKIINHKELIYNINSFYSASGKLFFKTQGKTNKFFMIELSTKDIYQFNYLFEGLHPKTSATSIIGSSSDELYFIFNKSDLINHYKKRKSPTKIPAIANLLNNPNDFHDTILILCKIKQYENPN